MRFWLVLARNYPSFGKTCLTFLRVYPHHMACESQILILWYAIMPLALATILPLCINYAYSHYTSLYVEQRLAAYEHCDLWQNCSLIYKEFVIAMANRSVKNSKSIRGTNPQYLVGKIIRSRVYDSKYWKEECFALTAELLVDKAMDLRYDIVYNFYFFLRNIYFIHKINQAFYHKYDKYRST